MLTWNISTSCYKIINYIVSLVFRAVKDTFIESVFATGSMVVELAENQINSNFII